MLLVLALIAFFCLVGLGARRFDAGARLFLLGGIVVLVALDLVGRLLQ